MEFVLYKSSTTLRSRSEIEQAEKLKKQYYEEKQK
jgi:hypothetical protein